MNGDNGNNGREFPDGGQYPDVIFGNYWHLYNSFLEHGIPEDEAENLVLDLERATGDHLYGDMSDTEFGDWWEDYYDYLKEKYDYDMHEDYEEKA